MLNHLISFQALPLTIQLSLPKFQMISQSEEKGIENSIVIIWDMMLILSTLLNLVQNYP